MGFSKWEWLVLWNPIMQRKIVFGWKYKIAGFHYKKLEMNWAFCFVIWLEKKPYVSISLASPYHWCSYLTVDRILPFLANFWYFSYDFNSKQISISGLETAAASFLQTYFLYVVFVGIVSFLYYSGPIFPTAYFTPKA